MRTNFLIIVIVCILSKIDKNNIELNLKSLEQNYHYVINRIPQEFNINIISVDLFSILIQNGGDSKLLGNSY